MATIDALQLDQAKKLLQPKADATEKVGTPKFADTLSGLVGQVDGLQKEAAKSIEGFIAGEEANLHDVMASMEEAQLSFQLMMEIRNKLLEGYQEVMRMQV
jgi:flagellar hook-basal body complex protein FliE